VGSRAGLDVWEKREKLCPFGFGTPYCSARSLVTISTTLPAPDKIKNNLNSVNVSTLLSDSVVFLCTE